VTTPLITTATGAKMGKTAAGAVWLNENRLPAFDYWQFWRNTADADVGRFLRLFTELPLAEIARLETLHGAELNEGKVVLAYEATKLCRGEAAAQAATDAARAVFGPQSNTVTIGTAEVSVKGQPVHAVTGLPTTEVTRDELRAGINVADLLSRTGLAASKGEARRLIRGGGARLNDARIDDEAMLVGTAHLQDDQLTLSAGRKRHVRVRAV
jgi:tyrosyl-tRNA synthetase